DRRAEGAAARLPWSGRRVEGSYQFEFGLELFFAFEPVDDVARDRVFAGFAEHDLVHPQDVGELLDRNAADGVALVLDDVVAGDDRLLELPELHPAAGAPEVGDCHITLHFNDLTRHSETHCTPPIRRYFRPNHRPMMRGTRAGDPCHSAAATGVSERVRSGTVRRTVRS